MDDLLVFYRKHAATIADRFFGGSPVFIDLADNKQADGVAMLGALTHESIDGFSSMGCGVEKTKALVVEVIVKTTAFFFPSCKDSLEERSGRLFDTVQALRHEYLVGKADPLGRLRIFYEPLMPEIIERVFIVPGKSMPSDASERRMFLDTVVHTHDVIETLTSRKQTIEEIRTLFIQGILGEFPDCLLPDLETMSAQYGRLFDTVCELRERYLSQEKSDHKEAN